MTDTIIGAIIGIGGTIIGVIIAGPITYWFSKKLIRESHINNIEAIHITQFNHAATEFQCSFLEALQKLRDDERADWQSILNSKVLLGHEKAALKFKIFLSDEERKRFDADWHAYFTHTLHPGDRRPPEKTPEEWDNEENCDKFIQQIDTLLSYAKLK